VIGGVITSSLLTLVVVPVVYCYMDDLAQWLKRLFTGKAHPSAIHSQTPPKIDALPRSAE
jgi:hydrophobic/amphiphilic exporter-1 (mainly G- bacteria), HAE1 family